MHENCPILPDGFFRSHKSGPSHGSTHQDMCIDPVVNEKSPQSIITDVPNKKTSISSKYWRQGTNSVMMSPEGRQLNGMKLVPDMEHENYMDGSDAASCTSSPVYAELDGNNQRASGLMTPVMLTGSSSISPYAVCNPYSEVNEVVMMAALASNSALLPESSYDNAAYLPSSNSDQYRSRSLRRHRAALQQLAAATPLLQSNYGMNGGMNASPQLNYFTGGRPLKKPRPLRNHYLAEEMAAANQLHTHDTRHARHMKSFNDLGAHSPAGMSTFRVQQQYFPPDPSSKRPLPPVPGVRL